MGQYSKKGIDNVCLLDCGLFAVIYRNHNPWLRSVGAIEEDNPCGRNSFLMAIMVFTCLGGIYIYHLVLC